MEQKQLTLNDSQKELDRAKRREMELEEELAEARERAPVLETLLAEDEPTDDGAVHENQAIYSAVQVDAARQARAVVFGGPPNWQAEVKKAAPGFTCIPVTQKGFDTKIIDKADVVVFKTDYMSHAQWYRVVKRQRARAGKSFTAGIILIYCQRKWLGYWFD